MERMQAFDREVTDRVARLCEERSGDRVLVLIDGPAGAGKTSMARRMAWHLTGREVATLHMDDLYDGWTGLDDALTDYLADQIVPQLKAGGPVRHRRYDWKADGFGEDLVLPDSDVLVIEGVGSGQPVLAQVADLIVWVEASEETCTNRLLARDGAVTAPHLPIWLQQQGTHFARHRTRERADVVLQTG